MALVVDDLAPGGERDVLERLGGERLTRRRGERDARALARDRQLAGGALDVVERPRRREAGLVEEVLAVDEQLAPAVARDRGRDAVAADEAQRVWLNVSSPRRSITSPAAVVSRRPSLA